MSLMLQRRPDQCGSKPGFQRVFSSPLNPKLIELENLDSMCHHANTEETLYGVPDALRTARLMKPSSLSKTEWGLPLLGLP